jgi:uncharacterized SAM-binding protein YcdF (DUF218 family)
MDAILPDRKCLLSMMNKDEAIDIIWEYMQLHQPPQSADVLIILGGRDDRVAPYGAQLANLYHYDYVVVMGGTARHNSRLRTWQEATESEHFAAIFTAHNKNGSKLLIEPEASSTGENATLSYQLLKRSGSYHADNNPASDKALHGATSRGNV